MHVPRYCPFLRTKMDVILVRWNAATSRARLDVFACDLFNGPTSVGRWIRLHNVTSHLFQLVEVYVMQWFYEITAGNGRLKDTWINGGVWQYLIDRVGVQDKQKQLLMTFFFLRVLLLTLITQVYSHFGLPHLEFSITFDWTVT